MIWMANSFGIRFAVASGWCVQTAHFWGALENRCGSETALAQTPARKVAPGRSRSTTSGSSWPTFGLLPLHLGGRENVDSSCRSGRSQMHVVHPGRNAVIRGRVSSSSEVSGRKRYPFASARQRFLRYRLQNPAPAKLEGKHQLFRGLARSAESFASRISRECKGAVSPSEAVGRKQ
ncbi:protein of unknown function [Burkholderia multivorans]